MKGKIRSAIEAPGKFDRRALLFLPRIRHRALTPLMLFVTITGDWFVWFPAAGLFIFLHVTGRGCVPDIPGLLDSMTAAFFSLIAGQLLKRVFVRERPGIAMDVLKRIHLNPDNSSMPSTHASTSAALFLRMLIIGHPWLIGAGPWALLVIFSRYYLGVHYPTDLLCGVILGAAFALVDWAPLIGFFLH